MGADPVPTFCPLCVSRCGARATVTDGTFVALHPDPSHPTGKAICLKGKAAPEHSLLKLFGSETMQKVFLAGVEAKGVGALDDTTRGPKMWREGSWITSYMRSFSGTIPGGTSEIQRNIIAERVLGLPRG